MCMCFISLATKFIVSTSQLASYLDCNMSNFVTMIVMTTAICSCVGGATAAGLRKPPMGFSSWNHFGMGVSAPLLLEVADSMTSSGLHEAGYQYINTDDGWNQFNRTTNGDLQPATSFTNATMHTLSDALHAKGFKFGIYGAAGFTTCGHRAGSLYHEFTDAATYKAWGVDYLKYDDCGEANIQSYAKYHVMKDALAAAYGSDGIDYYSFEPFQTYGVDAVIQMSWVSQVGDLWRTGADLRPNWAKGILANAFVTNAWAPNGRPGHYNDADMLEVGNGDLTFAEQRSHFALWCVMKSPLIIGGDVRTLNASSIAIMKNAGLIAVNQDDLGLQGTLRVTMFANGTRAPLLPARPLAICTTNASECASGSKWMTHCGFGDVAQQHPSQHWEISEGKYLRQVSSSIDSATPLCLTRSSSTGHHTNTIANAVVTVTRCNPSNTDQAWDFGRVNSTVTQIRNVANSSSCLTFNASSLHMEACQAEHGDKTTPNDSGCTDGNCRFSGIVYQLWYLNSMGQLTSAITNIGNGGSALLPMIHNFPANTPWCLATSPNNTPPPPPPPPRVDTSQPLQVWAGPLADGDGVVLLLNTGNTTNTITAKFADLDIRIKNGDKVMVTDVWTGKTMGTMTNEISASVNSHDNAVFRLSPTA